MKVWLFSNTKGGVFTFTTELAKGLSRKGCNVQIFFPFKGKSSTISEQTYMYETYYIIHPKSLKKLSLERPDIIHINFSLYGPFATLTKSIRNIPFIYTSHGLPQPWLEPALKNKIAYTIEDMLLYSAVSKASAVVSPSNYVKMLLKRRYGLDSTVIYHGVDLDKFKPRDKIWSRRQLGYEDKGVIILFVGKLHPYKDPLTLIRAISIAIKYIKDIYLIIIGSGELLKETEREIKRLKISKHVEILPWVNEEKLKLFYNAADIFVLPSVNEAFGLVLLEALASGLPVIASNTGACPEILGSAGILFSQGDSVDLANKIVEALHNEKLLEYLRAEGRKRAEKNFSWHKSVGQYFQLYRRTLSSKMTVRNQNSHFDRLL